MPRGDEGEAAWEGHLCLQLRDCSAGWPSCSGDELLLGVADQLVLQQAFSQLQQVQEACASALPDASIAASFAAFWTLSLLIHLPRIVITHKKASPARSGNVRPG